MFLLVSLVPHQFRQALVPESAQNGTLVTVRCENVPAGIRREDHQAGLSSTLNNLAALAEGDK